MKKRKFIQPQSFLELKELSDKAIRFGYLSFLLGPLTLPTTIYFWLKTERAAKGRKDGKKLVSRAREGRNVAFFASVVWTLLLVIRFAG